MPAHILHRTVQTERPVGGPSLHCLPTRSLHDPRRLGGGMYVLNVCLLVMEAPSVFVPRAAAPRLPKVSSR
eukprot:9512889-Lingulodinium_polyedra.AAC.1